jgi:hypothetical protein
MPDKWDKKMKKKENPKSSLGQWLHSPEDEHEVKKNTKESKEKKINKKKKTKK